MTEDELKLANKLNERIADLELALTTFDKTQRDGLNRIPMIRFARGWRTIEEIDLRGIDFNPPRLLTVLREELEAQLRRDRIELAQLGTEKPLTPDNGAIFKATVAIGIRGSSSAILTLQEQCLANGVETDCVQNDIVDDCADSWLEELPVELPTKPGLYTLTGTAILTIDTMDYETEYRDVEIVAADLFTV